MSFASETGYIPVSIGQLMTVVRENVNAQFGTEYDETTFQGTNFYKYFYALIQRLQSNEVKTSEIFQRLQEYFNVTNEKLARPNTTAPGIFDYFESKGFFVSVKPPIDEDAGKIFICVDTQDNHARGVVEITDYTKLVSGTDDAITVGATAFTAQAGAETPGAGTFQAATSNEATAISLAAQINANATAGALVEAWAVGAKAYIRALAVGTAGNSIALSYTDNDTNVGATVSGANLSGGAALADDEDDYDDTKLALCGYVRDCVVGGVISQGTEQEEITLSNNQAFTFKYNLPTKIPVLLRLTLTLSENNQFSVGSPDSIKETLMANIAARYKLGMNFEPQRYFSVIDAPWAAQVLLEWSDDAGGNWYSTIYDAEYDEVFSFDSGDISIVEE